MNEQKMEESRFIMWFSAVLIPLIGIGLYVYELFFKDNKPVNPVVQSAPVSPSAQDPGKIEAMERRLAEIHRDIEQMCRDLDFSGALTMCENNLPEFTGFPELGDQLRQELAGVYYKWAKMLKNRDEYDPDNVRGKLEKCLEIAPQGKYAGPARELLERLK